MLVGQFPQTDLVDREEQQADIRDFAKAVVETDRNHVLYFRADGGLGKTRLLKEAKSIIKASQPHMLVSVIVDMYDYENRKPIEIERKIVDGILEAAVAAKLRAEDIDDIFLRYRERYAHFHRTRGVSHENSRNAENQIHDMFIACCNQLSKTHPLVFRFDTLEAIKTNAPDYAFSLDRTVIPGIPNASTPTATSRLNDLISSWFERMLKELQRVLVLVSGRPPESEGDTEYVSMLQQENVIYKPVALARITETTKILEYLKKYQYDTTVDRVSYIRQVTTGLPLLLTLYARTRDDANLKNETPNSKGEFEDNLIEQTFNLLNNIPPRIGSDEQATEREVFIFCLFVLSCARRGIRRKDLHDIFNEFGLQVIESVINSLEDETLIRSTPGSYQPNETEDRAKLQRDNTLLFLHDEILALIDQSDKLDELEYRQPILDFLCKISQKQVHELKLDQPQLGLLSDHMFYELSRDITVGYRTYVIYVDWLLRQRYSQNALILAEVFWNTIYYLVKRGPSSYQPFLNQLLEASQITPQVIRDEEELRYVKRLRFTDQNQVSVNYAQQLYARLAGVPVQDKYDFAALRAKNTYLYVDLCLTVAAAAPRLGDHVPQIISLLDDLIVWLEQPEAAVPHSDSDTTPLWQHMAYMRRTFHLAEAYNLRGQIYRSQQSFAYAVRDLRRAAEAFREYSEDEIPLYSNRSDQIIAAEYLNDKVLADIAQIENNLVYAEAETGELQKAKVSSDMLIQKYVTGPDGSVVTAYQQALFYNTNALIHLRLDDLEKAATSLEKARKAASLSSIDRAIGLVAQAETSYQRAMLSRKLTKALELGYFENKDLKISEDAVKASVAIAKGMLASSPANLGEVFLDYVRAQRDLFRFYQRTSDFKRAIDHWNIAIKELAKGRKHLSGQTLLLATANELEAAFYIMRFGSVAVTTRKSRSAANGESDLVIANGLLDNAITLLKVGGDLPSFANLVSAKVELQRGLLAQKQGDTQAALRSWAIAVAQAHHFAPDHRDLNAFKKLIKEWAAGIDPALLESFVRNMCTTDGTVPFEALRFKTITLNEEYWSKSWDYCYQFFQSLVEKNNAPIA